MSSCSTLFVNEIQPPSLLHKKSHSDSLLFFLSKCKDRTHCTTQSFWLFLVKKVKCKDVNELVALEESHIGHKWLLNRQGPYGLWASYHQLSWSKCSKFRAYHDRIWFILIRFQSKDEKPFFWDTILCVCKWRFWHFQQLIDQT